MSKFKRTTTAEEHNEKVEYVVRLLAHKYTDEEIFNDLTGWDPRLVSEWISTAKLRVKSLANVLC